MKVHRKCITVCAVSLLLAILSGCATHKGSDSSNPAIVVQTARILDLQQQRMIPVNSFSSEERMAAIIKNLTVHDHVLQVEFVRQDSGLTIWKNAASVPVGQLWVTGPTAALAAGSYAVKVSGTGVQPITCAFTVHGQ